MNEIIVWSPGVTLDAIEKEVILKAYRFYKSNKTQTASALGIAIRTLDHKLERYLGDGKAEKERRERSDTKRAEFLARQRNGNGGTNGIGTAQASPSEKTVASAPQGVSRNGAAAGVHVEPANHTAEKPAVPVSERSKVQTVLPAKTAESHTGKRR